MAAGVRLTKKAATAEAKRQLGYGHFATSASTAWVSCPRRDCSDRIQVEHMPWDKPAPHLQKALVEHLQDECTAEVGR